ncbi:hypothetical protein SAMN05660668_02797 [Pseudobutyrivibrio sp. AR14]|nr:hypothetical protein [Pseudobutyrivibrio sp. AR14]SCY48288.1 hypothetical protein SAMN05660668_02797 [Pseudobutyrivibrio sp. AR14]
MSVESKYKKKNMDIQQQIKKEMENAKNGKSTKDYTQLRNILEELEKMMNNKCLPLNYPRIIVDSWDFTDELGLGLLELAEIYKRWK